MANPDHTNPDRPNFPLSVDSEHKATVLRLFTVAQPHMRAFHITWISYFCSFISTFAAAPLLPIIRDNLNLTATEIGNAGIASVSGAVFARVVMGSACDMFGPRLASSALLLLVSPAVYCFSIINSAASFLVVRFLVGFSLATFVATQFWMSSMFSTTVVGTANAVSAGWGNFGGGATQIIMPYVFSIILDMGAVRFTAWRIAFFIPSLMQTTSAFSIFFLAQDLPDGNFTDLKKSVELTVDNIIAQYFYDRFNVNLHTAGIIAASFGLANIFSRPTGGIISDAMAKRFGMRGRLWALWTVQSLGGLLCIVLGRVGSLGASIAVLVAFSLCVQASCGLTFGIVPFISRRSLGIASGMTGGGGNFGALLTQLIFFRGSKYKTETGITLMGVMMICCTLPVVLLYFPQWGGMFCGPSSKEGSESTEEEYYMNEWSSTEKDKGFHKGSLKFANNSRSERGKRVGSAPTPSP
ncbi:hypothetical protein TEA_022122 [Camellia sinensis var. sinensis]|uniref:Major facilitator superfamily (MFS) profile domain-containing protein n=1 Tax=Camellia sinensis var. sinensis TaxID=542762 RepID=A0A4S4DBG8_CAMSN|nr:hypothetical protein TEA_022122 [Camellia sinensis var. sinensis]